MYDVILFDLDGTLTDPGIGITNSVAYALEKLGIPVPQREALYPFIGPPLLESFQRFYGLSLDAAREAVTFYRAYFADRGMFENRVYDGVEGVLAALKAAGKRLAVATSKPEVFARQILDHFGLTAYFSDIAGASLDESRIRKDQVIAYALETCQLPAGAKAIMAGDREHDILGAKQHGLDSIGVLYGYGSYEELKNAGATYLVETVEAILPIVL